MSQLFIDRLSPTELHAIERLMRDRKFSGSRFLGPGESLAERIRADAAVLAELGVTHDQISDRLDGIVREANRLRDALQGTPEYQSRMEEYLMRVWQDDSQDISRFVQEERAMNAVTVEGRFYVAEAGYRGFQLCPFDFHYDGSSIHSCGRASRDIEIRNISNGMSILFSELLIHMIRDHQFFEGEGLRYRLDPKAVVGTLEL